MKLPQQSSLTLLSVALFGYLCGDLTSALIGRQLSDRPQRLEGGAGTPEARTGPTNPGELLALLNAHPQVAPPPKGPSGPTPLVTTTLPVLVGTLEGQGQTMALLQAPGSQETTVVPLGQEFQEFTLIEVSAFQARLRDGQHQEHTISMGVANPTSPLLPPPDPVPNDALKGPYKTSRELRQDIDNKQQWIGNLVARPLLRNGESIGVQIHYRGGENPFSRLGIQSGDVVLSLNNRPALAVDNLPDILMELRNAQTLVFQLERNGQPLTLTVNLEP